MRYLCVLLALLGMPLAVSAQQHAQPDRPRLGPGAIGLPLPPIGLPYNQPPSKWDRVQKPSWQTPQVPAWQRQQPPWWETQGPPPWERGHVVHQAQLTHDYRRWQSPSVVYVVQPYPYLVGSPQPVAIAQPVTYTTPPPPAETGRLRLEVEPAALLQIYVDGVYVGTPADLGSELDLRPGSHRIEVRAPGYETLTFDTRIETYRTITYRGELKSIAVKAPAAPAIVMPAGSRTLYVIPGCYLGNVPPEADRLPVGCDMGRMKTHAP